VHPQKEVAMLRKSIVVLAIALVLGSSALSTSAFARRSGGGRIADDGCGRIAGDDYCHYGGHVSGLRGGFQGYGQRDVWGHWGAYYGPMVH
jgi:hypothetical protein